MYLDTYSILYDFLSWKKIFEINEQKHDEMEGKEKR